MPPRRVVAVVVVGWLAALGWLAYEQWLPWLRPNEEPIFAVELADEVAPELANWGVYRKGKRIGHAETGMIPRKDGHFELTSRMRDLELSTGPVDVKIPLFVSTRTVTRQGSLLDLSARASMAVRVFGSDVKVDSTVRGAVRGDHYQGTCDVEIGPDKSSATLEPIRIGSRSTFSPMQPLNKFPPLRPGQTWRISTVDPVSDALEGAIRQVTTRMLADAFRGKSPINLAGGRAPTELLAQVQSETDDVTIRGQVHPCWVIVYRADEVVARTWVSVADGRVLRQEATAIGDTLVLQRD